MKKDNSGENIITCKNCSTEFKGNFCPKCGQSIQEYDQPISFLIVDMLGNFFAFDTRFWNTFSSLVIKPGKYAKEYLLGHRAKYAPPIRVYLFISLAFFLLLSSYINGYIDVSDDMIEKIQFNVDKASDSLNQQSFDEDDLKINLSGDPTQQESIAESLKKIINNPQIYVSSFLRFFSWSLFFLMPVYAAILWLLNKSTKQYYFGHLVFSLNQHALIFLVFAVLITIKLIFPNKESNYENLIMLYIPFYLIVGSKKLYENSWIRTFFKMLLAWFLYIMVLSMAIGIILVLWFSTEF